MKTTSTTSQAKTKTPLLPAQYRKIARKRWGSRASFIQGVGRYALLAHCRQLTVSLHQDMETAVKQKEFIDRYSCGGMCNKNHEIKDLGKR